MTRIRPMQDEDIAEVLALQAKDGFQNWTQQHFQSELDVEQGFSFVAENDTLVGYAVLKVMADEAELLSIVVSPDIRRQGLGGMLLDTCLQAAQGSAVQSVFLEVRADNTPAIGLYYSRKATMTGRRKQYYADGGDALLMRLEP